LYPIWIEPRGEQLKKLFMPFKFVRYSKDQSLIGETKERVREEISITNDHVLTPIQN
jgi:hypothetical protein